MLKNQKKMIGKYNCLNNSGKCANDEKKQIWRQYWKGRGEQIQKPSGKGRNCQISFLIYFLSIQNGRHVQAGFVGLLKHEGLFLDFQVYLDSN